MPTFRWMAATSLSRIEACPGVRIALRSEQSLCLDNTSRSFFFAAFCLWCREKALFRAFRRSQDLPRNTSVCYYILNRRIIEGKLDLLRNSGQIELIDYTRRSKAVVSAV